MNCNLCNAPLAQQIYQSGANLSLTSLGTAYQGVTQVYFCSQCGHMQSAEIKNIDDYYDRDYDILVASDDEDQIYEIKEGHTIYRTAHQVRTLIEKNMLDLDARVLDYGCAKSSTMRALQERNIGVRPYLFDVSDRYIPFWEKFLTQDRWATYHLPIEWSGHFDMVTSFFSLEHMAKPQDALSNIHRVLKDSGVLYGIVPYVFTNTADMIVVDHVNHFTEISLRYLLETQGFGSIEIDTRSHKGALVFSAKKGSKPNLAGIYPSQSDLESTQKKAAQVSTFWATAGDRIRAFEATIQPDQRVAIYGAGFYGMFIATCLRHLDRVECVVDQNAFLQGKVINGMTIVSPIDMPAEISTILVGLNPAHAESVIEDISVFKNRNIEFFYL